MVKFIISSLLIALASIHSVGGLNALPMESGGLAVGSFVLPRVEGGESEGGAQGGDGSGGEEEGPPPPV